MPIGQLTGQTTQKNINASFGDKVTLQHAYNFGEAYNVLGSCSYPWLPIAVQSSKYALWIYLGF